MAAPGSNAFSELISELVTELPERVRGGQAKLSEQAVSILRSLAGELNLVFRDEVDELELRVAQLEHRLRLLEHREDGGGGI
jgi:polyhydroxyalkanoate synthesis regulator phasin